MRAIAFDLTQAFCQIYFSLPFLSFFIFFTGIPAFAEKPIQTEIAHQTSLVESLNFADLIKIHAVHIGLNIDNGWELELQNNGEGFLKLDQIPQKIPLKLSNIQMKKILDMIHENHFFELPNEIGVFPVDGGMRKITIETAKKKHSVTIPSKNHLEEGQEVQYKRVLLLWIALRELFDDHQTIDSRPMDNEFSNNLGK